MPIYRIADLNIKIEPMYKNTKRILSDYMIESDSYEFDASVTQEELDEEKKHNSSENLNEGTLILTKICKTVLESYDGFFFHSSSFMLDGEAYVFAARSGTGKSTHTAIWRRLYGDRITMINDDKPIIRKTDGKFYIYGTPWKGKAGIGNNIKSPVRAVYILKRGEENRAERTTVGKVFKEILEATVVLPDRKNMNTLLSLLDEFFSSVELFTLTCDMSDNAAVTAYNAVNRG